MGNAIELYDWNVYAIFAPFFAAQFFNLKHPVSALLATYAVFAVAFVMRPIGGFLFGWLADRHGRRMSMLLSVGLASAGSLLIGLAPTYSSVGLTASVVLVLARLIQGLAYGGEIASSHTYIAEVAPAPRRGLWSSIICISSMSALLVATLLGATLSTVLAKQQMVGWGWRVPFVVGGVLGIVALVLRRTLSETNAYEQARTERQTGSRPSMMRGIWQNRIAGLRVIGLVVGGTVFFYTWLVAAPAYAITVKHIPAPEALWSGVIATSVMIVVLPFAGALSDRIGRRPNFVFFTLAAAALSFPLNRLIQNKAWQLTLAMTIAGVTIALVVSILPAVLAELFPTHVRAAGIGVPYSLAVALCGGTAPLLQTWLATSGRGDLFIGYSVVLLLIGTVVVLAMPETKAKPLE
ncbi:MFS transporter [Dactylosporangium maewongense]|uniref:MFS transporter n=1 Tax=Dactylosporangium maewongense TaxID=634393 RepID=A0ABN2DG19_9ACTN